MEIGKGNFDARKLVELSKTLVKAGVHSKEDLIAALRLRRELKRVQDERYRGLEIVSAALANVEIETNKHDRFLDEPLHPIRPNVRRGSIMVDGKKLFLVETTQTLTGDPKIVRLWMRDE